MSQKPSFPGSVSQALVHQMTMTSQMNLEKYPKTQQRKVSQWQRNIQEVFALFQKDDLLEADDLGTALRALDLSPTVAQVNAMRDLFENEFIPYQKFETALLGVMERYEFQDEPIGQVGEDVLMQAFETLDVEKRGFVETGEFIELMKTKGEPMSEDEIAEMMHAAEDPDTHTIRYEDYILRLLE